MMYDMDSGYLKTGKEYILQWLEAYNDDFQITDDAIEYIIERGGIGFCELEETVHTLIDTAKEYRIHEITRDFIDIVLSN